MLQGGFSFPKSQKESWEIRIPTSRNAEDFKTWEKGILEGQFHDFPLEGISALPVEHPSDPSCSSTKLLEKMEFFPCLAFPRSRECPEQGFLGEKPDILGVLLDF